MKKWYIRIDFARLIVLILTASLGMGFLLFSFVSISGGGSLDGSMDNEKNQPKNKMEFTVSDFNAALKKARNQYNSNDELCEKLYIYPNQNIIDGNYEFLIRSQYENYIRDIMKLTTENLKNDVPGILIVELNEIFPEDFIKTFDASIYSDSVIIFSNVKAKGYESADDILLEMFSRSRPYIHYEYIMIKKDKWAANCLNFQNKQILFPTEQDIRILDSLPPTNDMLPEWPYQIEKPDISKWQE